MSIFSEKTLEDILSPFDRIVKDLENFISKHTTKISVNTVNIADLQAEIQAFNAHIEQATKVKQNIASLTS